MRAYWVFLRIGVVCLVWSSLSSPLRAQDWFGSSYTSIGSVNVVAAPGATSGSNAMNLQVTATDAAGPPTPPTAPGGGSTKQGWAALLSPFASTWVRVEGLFPPVSGSGTQLSNAPFLIVEDAQSPSDNYLFLGSAFTTQMTAQFGTWPISSLSQTPAFNARTAANTPMRLGIVCTLAAGQPPSENTAYVNNGEPAQSGVWPSYTPYTGSPLTQIVYADIGGFVPGSSSSENVFTFQTAFLPQGGEFYQYSDQSFSAAQQFGNVGGDPWVLFNGTTSVGPLGSISIVQTGGGTGYTGILEFLGNLTVQAGGSVSALSNSGDYNTTIVNGPSHTFTGPGTMDLGQVLVESADWQLVNATVTATQGGPSAYGSPPAPWPAVLFYPYTKTTLDANSRLETTHSMELRTHATLAGLGTVQSDGGFDSNGRIQPGTTSQLGTLTFAPGTVLTCDPAAEVVTVVTPTGNSQLLLQSPPNLGGTLLIQCLRSPGAYRAGDVFTVVQAPSFVGNFTSVLTPGAGPISAFLSLEYQETPTQKNIVVNRYATYSSTACTENDKLVAGALDVALATACASPSLLDGLAATLDTLSLSAFSCGCVWDQVAGLEVLGLLESGIANASQLTRSVQWELWRAQDPWALSSQGSTGRVWGDGSYGQASWTAGTESLHLHSRGGFGILGAEAQLGQNGLVGVAAHYSPSHQRWDALDSRSKLWLAGGGLYAGWSAPDQWWIEGGSWYATGSAQFDYLKARLERTPLVAGPLFDNSCSSCLKGATSGMTTTARLESGYRWNTALLMQPYVALQGTWVHLNAFSEEGAPSALPLRTWSNSAHESFLSPGFRLSTVWTSPNGHLVAPELVLEVNQALGDRRDHAWVGFEGSPYLVSLGGAPLPRTLLFLSGGIQLVWGRHVSGQLRVNLQKGSGFTASGADAQLAVTF